MFWINDPRGRNIHMVGNPRLYLTRPMFMKIFAAGRKMDVRDYHCIIVRLSIPASFFDKPVDYVILRPYRRQY